MLLLFVRKTGPCRFEPKSQRVLEGRRTTTAGWYVHHCLQKVFDVWCQLMLPRTGLRDLFLHHDTDSVIARTAATAVGFLDEGDVQLLPYWPELAPYNFFLFPELKKPQTGTLCLRAPKMHGRMFARAAEDIKLSKSTWDEYSFTTRHYFAHEERRFSGEKRMEYSFIFFLSGESNQ